MDTEIPLSITGYVHEFEATQPVVIPTGIILIICEYCKQISFHWDREHATDYVEFVSNDDAQPVRFDNFGIIIGDLVISKKTFKKYSYSISIDKVGKNSLFYGFVAAPFEDSIGGWNDYYCVGGNADAKYRSKQYQLEVWHWDHALCAYGGSYGVEKRFQDKRYKLKDGDILRCEADFDQAVIVFSVGIHQVVHTDVSEELIPSICAPNGTIISLHEFDCQLR